MDEKVLYQRWVNRPLEDADLVEELAGIADKPEEIFERFYRDLAFGTAGLRGVLGAGHNRMNIYTIRRATQGLADYLNQRAKGQPVALAYDSRIKSDLFAREAAGVLAANGIPVYIYRALRPVPMLSFATRALGCAAGIMVTASHNPAKYNGYKVYGADGGQLTEAAADAVLECIAKLDIFDGAKTMSFEQGVEKGVIRYIEEKVENAFYDAVLSCQMSAGICAKAGLKLVYSPLNGAGNQPVRHVLAAIGAADVTVVPEQELPDGNFPTCPFPNPEIHEALEKGLELCRKIDADMLLATDPDCDRVGIAVRDGNDYRLITGNQVGSLLLDYICRRRIEQGTMPKNPVAVKTIVSTKLANIIGAHYGVEVRDVLTGFKYIGEQIGLLEQQGEADRFLFGFEESYGYLSGTHVRDKDGVVASMLIVEMAAWYKQQGLSLVQALDHLYEKFGLCCERVLSFEFEGAQGMQKMSDMMDALRKDPPVALGKAEVVCVRDYLASTSTTADDVQPITLPKSNVLEYLLENGCAASVRPSGTEPKIKLYLSVTGENEREIDMRAAAIEADVRDRLGV